MEISTTSFRKTNSQLIVRSVVKIHLNALAPEAIRNQRFVGTNSTVRSSVTAAAQLAREVANVVILAALEDAMKTIQGNVGLAKGSSTAKATILSAEKAVPMTLMR